MAKRILDDKYWAQDFAVTDGDVTRLHTFLQQAGRPQKAMNLLAQVVHSKLDKESLELDARQRQKSEAAAKRLLKDQTVRVYHQTDDYALGERLLVGWQSDSGWHYSVGEVVAKKASGQPHYRWTIRLRFANREEELYVAGANLSHPLARRHNWQLFDIETGEEWSLEQASDQVMEVYGTTLLPHLLGRLDEDERFVRWTELYWLAEELPRLPEDVLDRAATYLWTHDLSATTEILLQTLRLPVEEPHHWALNLALTADARFKNDGTEATPQWTAPLPDHLLRLPDGTLLDLSMPVDDLWARYHGLFRDPLPEGWTDNPHVLTFSERWLLDALLIPLEHDDLVRVREHLEKQGQAVTDVDILKDLFGVTPRDDDYDRWRFSLSYCLNQKAHELGVEFVGAVAVWSWALEQPPMERPQPHIRLKGVEGLPTRVMTEEVTAELRRDDEPLDVPAEETPREWKPTRQTWEHVLTYYEWENGVLSYNRQAREMIPPLDEGQQRAVLHFVAEQMDDEPFEVNLYAQGKARWLQGARLREFFVSHLRVPGARIWVDRTEEPGLYKIRYRPTEPRSRRLLFFEERVRPVICDRVVSCEVDETMLLAEGRYSDIEALDRLDLLDRRTAPKVLARIFELTGQKDESRGIYRAHFDDLFPLVCITKPYSKAYVQQILYDRTRYAWFYRDEERGTGWFVYDPGQALDEEREDPGIVESPQPQPRRLTETVDEVEEDKKIVGPPESPVPQRPAPSVHPVVELPEPDDLHIVYRIPFDDTPLSDEICEALQELVGPIRRDSETILREPHTPELLDEYLMQYVADKASKRFVTPRPVVDFMINWAQPKPGERVADICCGTGIFLVKALRFVKELYGPVADLELYGADIWDRAVEAARLNLLANGAQNFTVVQADSLQKQEGLFDQKYDLILGTALFGVRQARAFLRRWAELLTDGGRMAVNVHEGILSNSGDLYQELRHWLEENFEPELVVCLPHPEDNHDLYGAQGPVTLGLCKRTGEGVTL